MCVQRAGSTSEIEAESGGREYPLAGIITIMSTVHNGGEVLLIDEEERLVLIDGQRCRATENAIERLDWEP